MWIRNDRMRIRIHKNLMNADPDPNSSPDLGQYNHQLDFKPSFKRREKNIFKSVPKP